MEKLRLIDFDELSNCVRRCQTCGFFNSRYCFLEKQENCPIWNSLKVISDKAYFVSFDEYMQHQHEMIEERMQRMADQMLGDLKSAPHYPTEGTFWKNKEK